jgi:ferric-dicitrate binding protein FerR (iron transport regulator)
MRWAVVVTVLCALALFATGCRCSKSEALAILVEEQGAIERDTASQVGTWSAAKISAEFFVGDGVRSGKASRAALTLSDKSRLGLEESTIVRFLEKPSGSKSERIDLQMGEATIEVGSEPLSLETDVGLAVIEPGTRLSLKKDGKGLRYEVSVGLARFEGKNGEKTDVAAGQGVAVAIGAAQLERYETKPAAAPPPSATEPAAAPPAPPPPSGDITARVQGNGATLRAPGATTFARLSAGESRFAAGSTLRLTGGTSTEVTRGGERATLRGAGEFVVGQEGQSFIQTQGGGIAFSGVTTEVQVAVPGGTIVVKTGASADVRVDKESSRVAVSAGSVELRGPSGTEQLSAGEEGTLGAKGTTGVAGRGPGYVDFVAGAGASFAVHDPKPPTAIGFSTGGACSEGAVVDVDKGRIRSRGNGVVSVLVPAGSHRYDVHCVTSAGVANESKAAGTVAVLRDAGTARIPRTAATTLVDTDGRNYTVLYQNILPRISVRWPNPPASSSFTLQVASPGGKSESHSSSAAAYSFASGALREGVHRLTFDAGGGGRSKTTTLELRFDNAAPTATLTSPGNGFAPGSTVTVAGVALEGWTISAGGKELPLDAQLRFSGEVTAPSGERALAVQFVHPRRGLHYYLRRAAGH